jgi:deoxyadenosine/deoxycytidine kinase
VAIFNIIRTDPNVAYDRVLLRQRKEENCATFSYVQQLHEAHEEWLLDKRLMTPVLIVDANEPLDKLKLAFHKVKEIILEYSKAGDKKPTGIVNI